MTRPKGGAGTISSQKSSYDLMLLGLAELNGNANIPDRRNTLKAN